MRKRIVRFLWIVYLMMVLKPGSLKRFKIFCTKIDGVSKEQWAEYEDQIRRNEPLSKFFNL